MIKRLTPVLFVEAIEPCLEFWVGRLGFEKTIEVPEGGRLVFAALQRDGVEVMLQTYASLEKDIPGLAKEARSSTFLYIEVADMATLDEMAKRMEGLEVVVPRRETFYGATELSVRTPGGHVVTLAAFAAKPH